jgi:hypothetical protein
MQVLKKTVPSGAVERANETDDPEKGDKSPHSPRIA